MSQLKRTVSSHSGGCHISDKKDYHKNICLTDMLDHSTKMLLHTTQ